MAEQAGGAAAIARAIGSDVVRRKPQIGKSKPLVLARVDIEIGQVTLRDTRAEEPGLSGNLSPGRYPILVTFRRTSERGGHTIEVTGQAEIQLEWTGGDSKVTISKELYDPISAAVLPESGDCLELEYQLDIPADAAMSEGCIQLTYISGQVRRCVSLVHLSIAGEYRAAPVDFEKNVRLELGGAVRDKSLAVLHVSARNDKLDVTGYHPLVECLITSIPQPPVSLVDARNEQPTLEVYKKVIEYCRTQIPDVVKWLTKVLQSTEKNVAIVVVEHADSRVPWEMLKLNEKDPPVGASVVVTRWTAIQNYDKPVVLNPNCEELLEGLVLNFVNSTRLAKSRLEMDELEKCNQVNCTSADLFVRALAKMPAKTALVFLASHGTFVKDAAHRNALFGAMEDEDPVTTLSLEGLPSPAVRPALIVNACHSARISRTAAGVTGFPELFLAYFAHCYLGTLGAVDETLAAEVGAKLLSEARSPQGVDLPKFLLKLRQDEVRNYAEKETARRLVSAFMYVYYGPVKGILRLAAKPHQ